MLTVHAQFDQGLVDLNLKPPVQPHMVALVGLDVWLIKKRREE